MSHYLHAMRTKTQLLALTFSGCLLLTSCGGSDGNADALILIIADAGADGPSLAACNPVINAGCGPNEKCSKLNYSDTLAATTCVPDGIVPRGDPCTWGEPGATTGYDDCVGTNYCRNGICREICESGPDSCSLGNCVTIFNTFVESDGAGVCADPCDPVLQNCVVDNEGCYISLLTGTSSCSRIPEETAGIVQGDDCYGPDVDSCFRNGCPEGLAPILNKGGSGEGVVCAAFCSPAVQNVNDTTLLGGNLPHNCASRGAISAQCRFLQSFYTNTEVIDASVGLCVPPVQWGSCADHDPANPEDPLIRGCEPLPPAALRRALAGPKFDGDLQQLLSIVSKN